MAADSLLPPRLLLQCLADGERHSGQELANLLGVSRTAIWKQLAKCEALGLQIDSRAGKGYQLLNRLDLLGAETIRAHLNPELLDVINRLDIFDTIDSTNAQLMRGQAEMGIHVCLAEQQTAGRGRRGREWISPFAGNIYLSLGMTLDGGVAALEGLSLAVGVEIADSLAKIGADSVQLKWPNDILWMGQKLGGILIEVSGDPSGSCYLVVGIGLNIFTRESMTAIDQPWVALDRILSDIPARSEVAAILLNHLVPALLNYELQGFSAYRFRWEALNCHVNQMVRLSMGDKTIEGEMLGVNEVGALRLMVDGVEKLFHGGEISLRGKV